MLISELLEHTLKSIYNSFDIIPKKSNTQFKKPVYTCRSIFKKTYKDRKQHKLIHVNVFLCYLSCWLLVLRWRKEYLRSEMLLRTQPFIHNSCPYHDCRLRLFSSNFALINRQQYLFSLSQAVISFYRILLNSLHVGVLRITQKTTKWSLKFQADNYSTKMVNIFYTKIRKAFPKIWIMQHKLRFLFLPRSEITFHLLAVK
jgi:hypothetical protein